MGAPTIDQGDAPAKSGGRQYRTAGVIVDCDVPATMRDGVTLRADVYRPLGDGPWPVLLTRTCYGKSVPSEMNLLDPVETARLGFIVVKQDVRGRFTSEGDWQPFRAERFDGYDTVEWAARLPGSNGRVGMFGQSYWGSSQWLAAIEQPPSLAAISPALTWSEPMDGLHGRGGAIELGLVAWWSLEHGTDCLRRLDEDHDEIERRVEALRRDFDQLDDDGYWGLPVSRLPVLRRHAIADLGAIGTLDDPDVAEWCRVAGHHERVAVPSFHTAAWYDVFLQGTLESYEALAAQGRDARLIVGPWTHVSYADPVGEQVFGVGSYRERREPAQLTMHGDSNDLQLAWLHRQLVPGSAVELPEMPVRIFVMGRNEWREESSWPLERAFDERWYLHSGGSLDPRGPDVDASPSEYVYDPADPVPTVGGHTVLTSRYPAGPIEQARVEAREDVLIFTSEPLQHDLEVTGRVRVVLAAQSSATSTDWVARLCDVHPDGRSINLCDGIVRVADGANDGGSFEIDLWSTSNVFLAGHCLRVHVTSSSFPRWDRNLNTGDQHDPAFQSARQSIYHDRQRPSWIELPVIR